MAKSPVFATCVFLLGGGVVLKYPGFQKVCAWLHLFCVYKVLKANFFCFCFFCLFFPFVFASFFSFCFCFCFVFLFCHFVFAFCFCFLFFSDVVCFSDVFVFFILFFSFPIFLLSFFCVLLVFDFFFFVYLAVLILSSFFFQICCLFALLFLGLLASAFISYTFVPSFACLFACLLAGVLLCLLWFVFAFCRFLQSISYCNDGVCFLRSRWPVWFWTWARRSAEGKHWYVYKW